MAGNVLLNVVLSLGSRRGFRLPRTPHDRATWGRRPAPILAMGGPRVGTRRALWALRVVMGCALVSAGVVGAARGQEVHRSTSTGRPREPARPGSGWFGVRLGGDGPFVVDDVYPGSPAEGAGLRAGDTLVRIAGRVADRPALQAMLSRVVPGDTVRVILRHGPTTYTTHLRAGLRPKVAIGTEPAPGVVTFRLDALRGLVLGQLAAARARVTVIAPAGSVVEATDSGVVLRNPQRRVRLRLDTLVARGRRLRPGEVTSDSTAGARVRLARAIGRALYGMMVVPLPPSLLARGGPDEGDGGVLVATVRPRSAAARAGLRPLDVVVRAAGTPITTAEALERLLRDAARAGSKPVTLTIRRGAESLAVYLDPDMRDER